MTTLWMAINTQQ